MSKFYIAVMLVLIGVLGIVYAFAFVQGIYVGNTEAQLYFTGLGCRSFPVTNFSFNIT